MVTPQKKMYLNFPQNKAKHNYPEKMSKMVKNG